MQLYLQPLNKAIGALAQLVEQRTENPCVPGSIPGGTTTKNPDKRPGFLVFTAILMHTHYLLSLLTSNHLSHKLV